MGVAHSKSGVLPLSFWLHLAIDQTFQMRYITFLNSQWFKNHQPSNVEVLPTLTAGHFWTSGSSRTLCTSFERSDQWLSGARSSGARHHFYYGPHPFEKSHFTPYKDKCPVCFWHHCICSKLVCIRDLEAFSLYRISADLDKRPKGCDVMFWKLEVMHITAENYRYLGSSGRYPKS